MKILYTKGKTIEILKQYFGPYLEILNKATSKKLFIMLLSMIAIQGINSIRFLYRWFAKTIDDTSLNAYYYLFSYTELPLDLFRGVTIRLALSCIPEELKNQPVFLIIDDTLQEKYGMHFDHYQKMFDHAKHNGTNYLKGHCFVGMTISVPVLFKKEIKYLSIPIGYSLRKEKENKLEIASRMIEEAMEELKEKGQVILLCDSWYPKGKVIETVKGHKNLDMIASVRVDTSIYDLPEEPPKGKRGPKPKKGRQLDIHKDFDLKKTDKYYIGAKRVLTNLFEKIVYVTVTAIELEEAKTYKLFISTLTPEEILLDIKKVEKEILKKIGTKEEWLLPYYLYTFRWNIEKIFYEQKKFWSLGSYMLRKRIGIENYTNIIAMVYSAMEILPYVNKVFSKMKEESPQSKKYLIGDCIKKEIYLMDFMENIEDGFNSANLWEAFDSMDLFKDVG